MQTAQERVTLSIRVGAGVQILKWGWHCTVQTLSVSVPLGALQQHERAGRGFLGTPVLGPRSRWALPHITYITQ